MGLVIGSRHCDEVGQGRTREHGRYCSHLCRRRWHHAVAELGEPGRLNHISKMVLSIVKFGGPTCTVASTIFEIWLGSLGRPE